jgi:hypothetical protein
MRILKTLIAFELTFIVLIAGLGYEPVHASPNRRWTPDAKVPGYLNDTFTPFLLADQNRTVHAFASQWVDIDDGRRLAIVYRKWSLLGGWTRPVDIILSPIGGDANFLGAYMDSSDMVHIIFTAKEALTRKTSVYYSNAPAANADWGPAWSDPVLVGDSALDLNSAAIIGDKAGNLVVIYSGNRDGSGVYYLYSKDEGKSWSNPLPLLLTSDNNLSAFSLHLTVGLDQKIRATWNVVTNLGVDDALYFANYDTQTSKWDAPVELERRIDLPEYFGPSFPVMVDDGREILIMYNSGNPFTEKPVGPGRPIQRSRISLDGGLTWNDPLDPFPFHVGRSGEHAMVLDGKGTPHTLFIQRIETADEDGNYSIVGGIWHSTFENGGWANPDRFITSFAPHDVRAVVVQGNILLAVWRKDPGVGADGVWFSYTVLDEPELPVVPLATASVDYSSAQVVVATEVPALSTLVPTTPPELLDEAPPSNLGSNPALPIIIGTVPVVLILVGVVLGYRFLANRRE